MKHQICFLLAGIALITGIGPASASAGSLGAEVREAAAELDTALDAYHTAYPEIGFVRLRGEADITRLVAITTALGAGARNVDYEHPDGAREALREAQVERIVGMLGAGLPSATLFRRGPNGSANEAFTCIITLDERVFLGDRLAATRLLGSGREFAESAELDNRAFLRLTLDHEVFHCLDAYSNGSTHPQTYSQLAACYHDFRVEQRADLYAALAHRVRSPESDQLIPNLARFRTLAILDWDIAHYTAPVLWSVLVTDMAPLAHLGTAELANRAMQIADELVVSEETYRTLAAAVIDVLLEQGVAGVMFTEVFGELSELGIEADPSQVARLSTAIAAAQSHLSEIRVTRAGEGA
ncbi:MAG: hypothetical protein LJE84_05550 [Gammaproteobacteria bacterium]|nr:hypothetical protein [Gammaproteobacteria bacterium]